MASEVDICNLALAHLGDSATVSAITPPDGSKQADHCKRFYPVARDALLVSHVWSFASRRAALALLDLEDLPVEWAYGYAYPTCLKVLAVFPPDVAALSTGAIFNPDEFIARAQKAFPFDITTLENGSRVIYTNVEDAYVFFIRPVTDTTMFTSLFTLALARLLASFLAGPILKGVAGMKVAASHLKWFEEVDGPRAKASDAQSARNTIREQFIPAHIQAR